VSTVANWIALALAGWLLVVLSATVFVVRYTAHRDNPTGGVLTPADWIALGTVTAGLVGLGWLIWTTPPPRSAWLDALLVAAGAPIAAALWLLRVLFTG
jgi:hypothetical protein